MVDLYVGLPGTRPSTIIYVAGKRAAIGQKAIEALAV
jgi:hypothetical protein